MGISLSTQFVSTNDLISTRNSLTTLYALQAPTGMLPYAGPPLTLDYHYIQSDTYHAWTLVGTFTYVLYSGDFNWLRNVWSNYTRGVEYLAQKVDETRLLNVTGLLDWGRQGQGGHNSEANAIYYKVSTRRSAPDRAERADPCQHPLGTHQWVCARNLADRHHPRRRVRR